MVDPMGNDSDSPSTDMRNVCDRSERVVTAISTVSGTTSGRIVSECAAIGDSTKLLHAGCRIGPPTLRL